MSDVVVRPELPSDAGAIRAVVAEAFGRSDEADLVDRLRHDGDLALSLVAVADRVVGHVAFSRLRPDGPHLRATALAPVSVLPGFRRRGIAAALIRDGLARCAAAGEGCVLVLGEPPYYTRFGFSRDAARALRTPYDGPYLMAAAFVPAAAIGAAHMRYAPAFSMLT
ncbi:MAG TPA: N-acetyltransferase [Beijerinckiaceae bacterium]